MIAGALRRRLRRVCWWLLALGAWLMLMGLSTAHGVISGGALTAGGGCALVLWSALVAGFANTLLMTGHRVIARF